MAAEASAPPSPADAPAEPAPVSLDDSTAAHGHGGHNFWALALGAIGVVFGDIGTSPLYAMREALSHARGAAAARWRSWASSPWSSGP